MRRRQLQGILTALAPAVFCLRPAPLRAQESAPPATEVAPPSALSPSESSSPVEPTAPAVVPPAEGGRLALLSSAERATVRVIAFESVAAAVVGREMVAVPVVGHGSGVVVAEDGIVLTARHVVAESLLTSVWSPDRDEPLAATVVYGGEGDYAFLVVGAHFDHVVPMPDPESVSAVSSRTRVFVLGYPEDLFEMFPAVTEGIISRFSVSGNYQISAPVNPGNSGGPMLDEEDRLLGVVVQRHNDAEGMGYVLPIDRPAADYPRLRESGVFEAAQRSAAEAARGAPAELAVLNARWAVSDAADLAGIEAGHGAGWLRSISEACSTVVSAETVAAMERLDTLAADDPSGAAAVLHAAFLWNQTVCDLHRVGADSSALLSGAAVARWHTGDAPNPALDRVWRAIDLLHGARRVNADFVSRCSFADALFQYESAVRNSALQYRVSLPEFGPPGSATVPDRPGLTSWPGGALPPRPSTPPPTPEPPEPPEVVDLISPIPTVGAGLVLGPTLSAYPVNDVYVAAAALYHPDHHPIEIRDEGSRETLAIPFRVGGNMHVGAFFFGFDLTCLDGTGIETYEVDRFGSVIDQTLDVSRREVPAGHGYLGVRLDRSEVGDGVLHHSLVALFGADTLWSVVGPADVAPEGPFLVFDGAYLLGAVVGDLSLSFQIGVHLMATLAPDAERFHTEEQVPTFFVSSAQAAYRFLPWLAVQLTIREASRIEDRAGEEVDVLSFEPGVRFLFWDAWDVDLAGLFVVGNHVGVAEAQYGVTLRTGFRWNWDSRWWS
jgi:S1-C subfamily serine protease